MSSITGSLSPRDGNLGDVHGPSIHQLWQTIDEVVPEILALSVGQQSDPSNQLFADLDKVSATPFVDVFVTPESSTEPPVVVVLETPKIQELNTPDTSFNDATKSVDTPLTPRAPIVFPGFSVGRKSDQVVEVKRPYFKKVAIGTGFGAIAALVALVAFAIFFPPLGVGFLVGFGVAGAALFTLSAICIRNAFKAANHVRF